MLLQSFKIDNSVTYSNEQQEILKTEQTQNIRIKKSQSFEKTLKTNMNFESNLVLVYNKKVTNNPPRLMGNCVKHR